MSENCMSLVLDPEEPTAIGVADKQGDLPDDVARFCDEALPERSIYGFLRRESGQLFPDEGFAEELIADLLGDDDDEEEDHYRNALHEPWWREREVRRKGSFLAYAELILQPDGEVVSADLYGVDKLA